MTPALSVRVSTGSPHRAVLATLPNRFRATTLDASIIVIERGGAAAAPALLAGSTAMAFLADPAAFAPDTLDALVAACGGRAMGFALQAATALSNEAVALLSEDGDDLPFIVDCVGETDGADEAALRSALLEQMMLVEAMAGPITDATLLLRDSGQIIVRLDLASGWTGVRITARQARRVRFTLHAVSPTCRRTIEILPDPQAHPARVAVHDRAGTRMAPPLFQGGYRRSWIDFHAAIRGDTPRPVASLTALQRSLAFLAAMLGAPQ